ncbi:MAG: hypothetical protein GY795_21665, partial [Desulfobacterales bacterium]|nr:hypothetical protein [Desulfobacterales bacterium]
MYDILTRFILLQIWPKIKDARFEETDMEEFFLQARREGLIRQDDIVAKIYDAVTLLSWDYIPAGRTMKENDIFTIFEKFCTGLPGICSEDAAREWTQRLINDHLMIRDGLEDYIFIHSTMMEFLAARFIAQKLKNSQYLQTIYPADLEDALQTWKDNLHKSEAFPIASGVSADTGFYMLRQLKKLAGKPSANRNAIFVTAFKTLAEIENLIVKTEKESRSSIVKQEFQDKIESEKESSEWMYRSLKKYLLSSDEKKMKFALSQFHNVSRLSLTTLLKMIPYKDFADTSSSVYDLREKILFQLVKPDIAQQWVKINKEKYDSGMLERFGVNADDIRKGILLRLDTPTYHPDDKNFQYYQRHVGKELIGFFGTPNLKHSLGVNSVVISLDGKYIISGSYDNTVRLWDAATGKEIRTFSGHQDSVLSVSLSSDGRTLVSGSYDNTVRLWDAATGKEIRAFSGHQDSVRSVSLSSDGGTLVSGSYDNTV